MAQTPTLSRFDEFYKHQTPPWVIGAPQPAVMGLERLGMISGRVLDVGCGTGEHPILLTRSGYDVLGVDGRDRAKYVRSLHAATRPGGVIHVLALSDAGWGFGPEVSEATIRSAFGEGGTSKN